MRVIHTALLARASLALLAGAHDAGKIDAVDCEHFSETNASNETAPAECVKGPDGVWSAANHTKDGHAGKDDALLPGKDCDDEDSDESNATTDCHGHNITTDGPHDHVGKNDTDLPGKGSHHDHDRDGHHDGNITKDGLDAHDGSSDHDHGKDGKDGKKDDKGSGSVNDDDDGEKDDKGSGSDDDDDDDNKDGRKSGKKGGKKGGWKGKHSVGPSPAAVDSSWRVGATRQALAEQQRKVQASKDTGAAP